LSSIIFNEYITHVTDRSIFIIGGHDGTKTLDEVWEMDISKSQWIWAQPKIAGDVGSIFMDWCDGVLN
jgi:hypothetical protein